MSSKEIDDKRRLDELANAVRQKYNSFRRGEEQYESLMARKFKPLIRLVKDEKRKKMFAGDNDAAHGNDRGMAPVEEATAADKLRIVCEDQVYGLRCDKTGSLKLGDHAVAIANDIIRIGDNVAYEATDGLKSLLMHENPNNYTRDDMEKYKHLLTLTQAHTRKGKHGNRIIKWSKSRKYNLVRDLFKQPPQQQQPQPRNIAHEGEDSDATITEFGTPLSSLSRATTPINFSERVAAAVSSQKKFKRPASLPIYPKSRKVAHSREGKFYTKRKPSKSTPYCPSQKKRLARTIKDISRETEEDDTEIGEGIGGNAQRRQIKLIKEGVKIKNLYTYWDDPNELVDRLCLLHASQQAGNNNVNNEIISIETELREAGYIL